MCMFKNLKIVYFSACIYFFFQTEHIHYPTNLHDAIVDDSDEEIGMVIFFQNYHLYSKIIKHLHIKPVLHCFKISRV